MSELSIWLYDRVPRRYVAKDLWTWERDWFRSRLPPSPARILIGAAGSGREALPLIARGYQIDAFDPAAEMSALAASSLRPPHRALTGTFEELSAAVLDLADNPLSALAGATYDAVILGWGALSHVIDPAERERLITAAATLAPDGPVLASFFLEAQTTHPGRARQLGSRLGARIAQARGFAPSEPEVAASIDFSTNLGFTHIFSAEELEALAAGCDRTLAWDPEPGFPHATFLPR
jgi:hypothetical protein